MNNEIAMNFYKELVDATNHPGYRQEDLYLVVSKKLQRLEDDLVDESFLSSFPLNLSNLR
jgi:hypothetical protein